MDFFFRRFVAVVIFPALLRYGSPSVMADAAWGFVCGSHELDGVTSVLPACSGEVGRMLRVAVHELDGGCMYAAGLFR